jgi:hypothetical protein
MRLKSSKVRVFSEEEAARQFKEICVKKKKKEVSDGEENNCSVGTMKIRCGTL